MISVMADKLKYHCAGLKTGKRKAKHHNIIESPGFRYEFPPDY
jgi:hypothetical protein